MNKGFACKEGCGECCGIVPIPKEIARKTEHLAQIKPEKIFAFNNDLYIITPDMKCVYLDRKTKKCAIYKDRPRICRLYGLTPRLPCPYIKENGERRSLAERKLVQIQIDNTVDLAIKIAEAANKEK